MEDNPYLRIQEKNIQQREAYLKELGLGKEKQAQDRKDAPATPVAPNRKKRRPSPSPAAAPRKSSRKKTGPAPSYKVDDEVASGRRSRRDGSAKRKDGAYSHSQLLRPRRRVKPVNYAEEEMEDVDAVIFCTPCGVAKKDGCDIHKPVFAKYEDYDLRVSKSFIKGAGEGVVNHGQIVPEGIIFGPYPGVLYSPEEYKKMGESGYGWTIKKPDGSGPLGIIDPGPNPDPVADWMAKVNCTGEVAKQNLSAFQWRGAIYYR